MSRHGRILFIDAYDSFSNNIVDLLTSEIPVSVEVIKIDDRRFVLNDDAFFNFLDSFDAVVAGPGPGHPAFSKDAGLISSLWSLPEAHLLPVLGICFGFQSLAQHFGASVEQLRQPRHGMVTPLLHCARDIFTGTGKIVATRYHSLHVRLGHLNFMEKRRGIWQPSRSCKHLIPLAWDMDDAENGEILMGLRHCHKPFWGVQYHPESVCTNKEGQKLVSNWWNEVIFWQMRNSTKKISTIGGVTLNNKRKRSVNKNASKQLACRLRTNVQWTKTRLQSYMNIPHLVDILRSPHSEPCVLESGMRNGKPVNDETGRFSIIGVPDASSTHIRYSTSSHRMDITSEGRVLTTQIATISKVFEYLAAFTTERSAANGPAKVPYWGGLVGFISYEAGLETIDVEPSRTDKGRSDVWFVFVERSIVIDNIENEVYVQSIRDDDDAWFSFVDRKFQQLRSREDDFGHIPNAIPKARILSSPEEHVYQQKVLKCKEHLRAGSSYELCLTDQTIIRVDEEPWQLYLRLRESNPAPFGAYLRLSESQTPSTAPVQEVSVISSSPERFLSWTREGRCQFRPIKGTVKKTPGIDRAQAEELLRCPKEMAENLMIVDLIRHDLNGVKGVQDVRVPKLMSVEEYETVFQLVSVVEGDVESNAGIAVLAASLPPGSMTGAPKKRSCELLKQIESEQPRGLYSGVMGYLDVGGGGDFSVVIRTAFKWSDDNLWHVGAGGAVTAMSDAEAEWQEMNAKRESVLGAFGAWL